MLCPYNTKMRISKHKQVKTTFPFDVILYVKGYVKIQFNIAFNLILSLIQYIIC